ncbi:hypothetical protein Bbelb_423670 [Branchiostoma belcheri]|nr:hypothetical protein Bbelb_423670 [Branchiostoma belcheri]
MCSGQIDLKHQQQQNVLTASRCWGEGLSVEASRSHFPPQHLLEEFGREPSPRGCLRTTELKHPHNWAEPAVCFTAVKCNHSSALICRDKLGGRSAGVLPTNVGNCCGNNGRFTAGVEQVLRPGVSWDPERLLQRVKVPRCALQTLMLEAPVPLGLRHFRWTHALILQEDLVYSRLAVQTFLWPTWIYRKATVARCRTEDSLSSRGKQREMKGQVEASVQQPRHRTPVIVPPDAAATKERLTCPVTFSKASWRDTKTY